MDKNLPNFRHMDAEDGTIYGAHNVVKSVNPYKTYFIAHYFNGVIINGKNLFDTGWNTIPDGIISLQYYLSTGHIINIPKFKAYLPLIEVSESLDGARIFHSINVKCMIDEGIITYKIILKEDNISKYKIGDILITKEDKAIKSPYWKLSSV